MNNDIIELFNSDLTKEDYACLIDKCKRGIKVYKDFVVGATKGKIWAKKYNTSIYDSIDGKIDYTETYAYVLLLKLKMNSIPLEWTNIKMDGTMYYFNGFREDGIEYISNNLSKKGDNNE